MLKLKGDDKIISKQYNTKLLKPGDCFMFDGTGDMGMVVRTNTDLNRIYYIYLDCCTPARILHSKLVTYLGRFPRNIGDIQNKVEDL